MLKFIVPIVLIIIILLLGLVVTKPKIVVLEEDIPLELRRDDEINREEVERLIFHKLSRYIYIEDNKVKLKVQEK